MVDRNVFFITAKKLCNICMVQTQYFLWIFSQTTANLSYRLLQGSSLTVKIGDKEADVDLNFNLYVTTKLGNPSYTPEVSARTSIIDFTGWRERGPSRQRDRQTDKQTKDKQTDRQSDRQTIRRNDMLTDRQADRQTGRYKQIKGREQYLMNDHTISLIQSQWKDWKISCWVASFVRKRPS